jgi:hypothetical protein
VLVAARWHHSSKLITIINKFGEPNQPLAELKLKVVMPNIREINGISLRAVLQRLICSGSLSGGADGVEQSISLHKSTVIGSRKSYTHDKCKLNMILLKMPKETVTSIGWKLKWLLSHKAKWAKHNAFAMLMK